MRKYLLLLSSLILLFASGAKAQGTLYQLSPPAPNAQVLVCPSPDNGYPCPSPSAIFSDVGLSAAVAQPVSVGPSGFLSFYIAAGTYTIQLLGPGYNSSNRKIVSIGSSGGGGCAEGTCVRNAPTADQTITGAHALIMSDAGSSFLDRGTLHIGPDIDAFLNPISGATPRNPIFSLDDSVHYNTGLGVFVQNGTTNDFDFTAALEVIHTLTGTQGGSAIEFSVGTQGSGDIPYIFPVTAYPAHHSTGTLDELYYYYGGDPDLGGTGGDINKVFGFWLPDLSGWGATNPYYSWFDSRGVRRVKEDSTFDSVGQAIEALYNPQFTKYTPGAANYERVVLGQWSGNVAQIGTEAGGTGTPRKTQIIGPGFIVPDLETVTNCANGAPPAVCASAPSGAVAVPTGVNPTLVINTTKVTATSRIFLSIDESLTIAATTCNTTLSTLVQPVVTARTPGTSFTIQIGATLAVNPACVSYFIVN